MKRAPSFEDVFAVMSAASVGNVTARVHVPQDPELEDVPTRFGLALNVLLDDLSFRMTSAERMAERLRILTEASKEFTATTQDLDRLLESVAHRLADSVKDFCLVLLVSEDQRELLPVALDAPDDDMRRRLRELYTEPMLLDRHAMTRRVHETGEPFLWAKLDLEQFRAQTTPRYFAFVESIGMHSLLVAPLRLHGRSIGQIVVVRYRPESPPFEQHDLSLACAIADHAVLAIANARSFEQLRESRMSEATFRGLVEAAPDAVVIANSEGKIQLVNAQTEKMYGYTRDEMVGQPTEMVLAERFRDQFPRRLEGYIADPVIRAMGSGNREIYGRRKDGSEFPIEFTVGLLESAEGTLVCGSIRDITVRRRAEVALAHARDAAEAANRELEAFSYSVAHDLRAPLRGMNGFAQLLLDGYRDKLDAEGQDWLQEILLNARKMAELIDGLLSLARLTRSELRRVPVDLSSIVRTIGLQLSTSEPGRSVEIVVQDQLVAEVDPVLARALLENLLGNAWKFTSKTPIARIELGVTDKEGARAFFVRDNGAGFDMAFAGKLFAPFQRLHTTAEFSGTGIGLATVQRIVHRHGGRIWAEGAVDAGATFYFTLPAPASGAIA
jgi:PAS domain S-box-containing protein